MKYRRLHVVLLLVLTLVLSGCSLGVESFLQPPKLGGQQQAVQTALETYLKDKGDTRYTLEYPVEGEHTAAFLLCDSFGYPTKDEPDQVIAFYSLNASPEETHIHLLRRDGEEWMSVADTVGAGVDIREVAFGDLNGDGTAEMITGWTTHYSRADQLMIYHLDDKLTPAAEGLPYTSLYVGDLTATGEDSLLVLTVADRVTATLQKMEGGRLNTVASVALDGGIRQFGSRTLCRLDTGIHGLYVEGLKAGDTAVTELIYYDGEGLHAPFYNPETDTTAVTTRPAFLAAQDIDGDGRVEVPFASPLVENATQDVGDVFVEWKTWDYATDTWRHHSYTLPNAVDGYMVKLDGGIHTHLAVKYNEQTHTLTLTDTDTKRAWLWLTVGEDLPEEPAEDLESLTLFSASQGEVFYYAWFDPAVVGAEKVQYMVTRLTREGG